MKSQSPRLIAVLQAIFVTFLWSTSWVLIKFGLAEIPALTFAGLRYALAFLCLLPFTLHPVRRRAIQNLSLRDWVLLVLLGLLFYTVTQGAQFVGLFYLPAMTVNLLLNFTTLIVALLGILFLAERPAFLQWIGTGLFLAGVVVYFYPAAFQGGQVTGLLVTAAGVLANALSSILGRSVNRGGRIPTLVITTISMGFGAILLLGLGLFTQGLPRLNLANWLIVLWLAVVNTALAFTLWNHTLRTLTAVESSMINNTMIIQIAVLAWLFLGEELTWQKGAGLVLVAIGMLTVQLRKVPLTKPKPGSASKPAARTGSSKSEYS